MVTVRFYAGARAVAGTNEESVDADDIPALLDQLGRRHGERMRQVLDASTLLVNGVAATDRYANMAAHSIVEVLPPFAGG